MKSACNIIILFFNLFILSLSPIFFDNQVQSNVFKDTNFFDECHKNCKECNGPTEHNCLKCADENFFIYNGTCIN